MENLSRLAHLIPPYLRNRPTGDPVGLAHWYIGGQKHWPCVPGSGCSTCWDTLTGILDGAGVIPEEDLADPETEKAALDLLELWYGQASTVIEVWFGPNIPSFSPDLVPTPGESR